MSALVPRQKLLALFSFAIVIFLVAARPLHAEYVTTTVSAGPSPQAVGVNPTTNKIYVANTGSNTITVANLATRWRISYA